MDIVKSARIIKKERMQRMKPEIIFVSEKDGMVTMKKEELEALVEKAYQAGRSDISGTIATPYVVPTSPLYGKAVEITCSSEGKG